MDLKSKFKSTCFYAFLITLLLMLYQIFVFSVVYTITKSETYSYLFAYLIVLVTIVIKNRKSLMDDAKNIKKDTYGKVKHLFFMYFLFLILQIIANTILYLKIGTISDNQTLLNDLISEKPLIMFITLAIIGPIIEELTFRYPYRNALTNKKVKFGIYTIIFALSHITVTQNLIGILYIIPYLFLSLSISYSYYKTDNIYTSMFFHILNNIVAVLLVIL
ncbi:MAG: CPBP family intramembrane metalloprotease [Erysipelotrichales bacterium]|nr:CPBP family intramembrane metalloprotease [Erysipelotrichales bacterium]